MSDVIIVAVATLSFLLALTLISLLPYRKKVESEPEPERPKAYIDTWVGGNSEARKRREEKLASQGEHAL